MRERHVLGTSHRCEEILSYTADKTPFPRCDNLRTGMSELFRGEGSPTCQGENHEHEHGRHGAAVTTVGRNRAHPNALRWIPWAPFFTVIILYNQSITVIGTRGVSDSYH